MKYLTSVFTILIGMFLAAVATADDVAADAATWAAKWRHDVSVVQKTPGDPESVSIISELVNVTNQTLEIGLELNYRMFWYEMLSEDGTKRTTPTMTEFPHGSATSSGKIKPGGKFEEQFPLKELVGPIKAGKYWIRVIRLRQMLDMMQAQQQNRPIVGAASGWVEFVIK